MTDEQRIAALREAYRRAPRGCREQAYRRLKDEVTRQLAASTDRSFVLPPQGMVILSSRLRVTA